MRTPDMLKRLIAVLLVTKLISRPMAACAQLQLEMGDENFTFETFINFMTFKKLSRITFMKVSLKY